MAYNKREVAIVVVVAMLASMAMAEAISCGTVSSDLGSCLNYLEGRVATPSTSCCQGVGSLYRATLAVRADRITSCNCIKTLAGRLGNALKASSVSSLPGACGVNLGYPISVSTNCATIK